jgi:hypothetical protein
LIPSVAVLYWAWGSERFEAQRNSKKRHFPDVKYNS